MQSANVAAGSRFAGWKMCYKKNWLKAGVYKGFKRFLAKKQRIFAVPAKGESVKGKPGGGIRRKEFKNIMDRNKNNRNKDSKSKDNRNKDKKAQLNICLSQNEKRRLKRKAIKSGLNLSEYARARLSGDGKQKDPGMVSQCVVLCQDILNIIEEKYSCEDNSLLEEKVEKLWKLLSSN